MNEIITIKSVYSPNTVYLYTDRARFGIGLHFTKDFDWLCCNITQIKCWTIETEFRHLMRLSSIAMRVVLPPVWLFVIDINLKPPKTKFRTFLLVPALSIDCTASTHIFSCICKAHTWNSIGNDEQRLYNVKADDEVWIHKGGLRK